ncbi:MAG: hypothetical protein AUJ12_08355 [Alphaproteobacteria bacterium CG1_02_46_17]|nr:MAG: hypothetical protein AUJ12_08355 [Alphaproteobacteria bacterium CG1_02_46_17]
MKQRILFSLWALGILMISLNPSPCFSAEAPGASVMYVKPDGMAAGTHFFGYSWPFEGRDLNQEFSEGPIVLELFSDPGCMFCPPADQFFNDLIRKTDVIALACHVNILTLVPDDPLTTQQCKERQVYYSALLRVPRITPQIFLNSQTALKGFLFKEVVQAIIDGKGHRPLGLDIVSDGGSNYHVNLPDMEFGPLQDFNDRAYVQLVEYRKPVTTTIAMGPNEGVTQNYLHVVSRFIPLSDWKGAAGAYHFEWAPSKEAQGAVLLFERRDTGILAVGEIKLQSK